MRIALGNDHVGTELKRIIAEHVRAKGHEVVDYGTDSLEIAQYPVYGKAVARAVAGGEADAGILICGTGLGMSMVANKVRGIRCAAVSDPYSARMAKEHNNANILAFGARVVGAEVAKMLVDEWLDSAYETRHEVRLQMIRELEAEERL